MANCVNFFLHVLFLTGESVDGAINLEVKSENQVA